ncbi:MAG: DUF932 domain-containing protein [Rhodobacteraceae bacterium]|nr:DUF932 domain-containing protein [Paracoccaceae bacterium]
MIYDNVEPILFPVEEVEIFMEMEHGEYRKIPNKKALVREDTRRVLSVVNNSYNLILNKEALRLARKCCIASFPDTAPNGWDVFRVEAPKTGGHCHIDLYYKWEIYGYDWSFSRSSQDAYLPFVRISNSYNRTRKFSIHFGFVRWICKNGMVGWDESIEISFTHDVPGIERIIEEKINEAKFRVVVNNFENQFNCLYNFEIPAKYFRDIVFSVLKIHKPKNLPDDREIDWSWLEEQVDGKIKDYVKDFGEKGVALLNVLTDIATRPPGLNKRYNFIHRESHALQRLTGEWLSSFTKKIQAGNFDLEVYVNKLKQS